MKPTKTLALSASALKAFRWLMQEWGFVIGRGPADWKNAGSIDTGCEMIAAGDALFVPVAQDTEYHPSLSAKLREIAERENLPILARTATALDRARKLKDDE